MLRWYFNLIWFTANFNLFLVFLHCNVCTWSFSQVKKGGLLLRMSALMKIWLLKFANMSFFIMQNHQHIATDIVATSPAALRWLCDSPRTGCAWRTTPYIYVARTSNNRVIMACELYWCLLPQCEALRACRSGFPIASTQKRYSMARCCKNLKVSYRYLQECKSALADCNITLTSDQYTTLCYCCSFIPKFVALG